MNLNANLYCDYFSLRNGIVFFLLLFPSFLLLAQTEEPEFYYLKVESRETDKKILTDVVQREVFFDSTDLATYLLNSIQSFRKKGYLLASFDSPELKTDTLYLSFYLGVKYDDILLDISELENFNFPFLSSKDYKKKYWSMEEIQVLENRLLVYSEDNGFPFASSVLEPEAIKSKDIRARITYNKGALIKYDSISFVYDSINIKQSFLRKKLAFRSQDRFSNKEIEQASVNLNNLPYIKLEKAPEINFEDENANVTFTISKEKANEFDGVIGFFPRQGNRGGMQLAGNINLHLHNLFASGKEFQLKWQRFQNQSQVLNASYIHPFILNSSLDLGAELELLQQDSTFSRAQRTVLIGYDFKKSGYLQFFAEWLSHQTGNQQSFTTEESSNIASGTYNSYGFKYSLAQINEYATFSSGHAVELKLQIGNKRIDADTTFNVQASKGVQTQLSLALEKRFRIGKVSTLKAKNRTAYLASKKRFRNEYFRIGGLQTLRGFNENVIFSSAYNVSSIEMLYKFNSISFYPFVDYGRWQEGGEGFPNFGYGTGLGLNLDVNGGNFNIVYALGGQKNQPLRFNEAKIHFGYSNKF